MSLKNAYFFFLIILCLTQSVHSQTTPSKINIADKYFAQKEYSKAKEVYYNLIMNKYNFKKNALLKLAFIHEREKDYTKTLYFLNLYYERNPTELVMTKMNSIANENNIDGYELTDFFLILLLIKQYSYILLLILAILGLYVMSVLMVKRVKKEPISIKQKVVFLLYLIGVFFIINISRLYKQGIIHNENTSLREDPSSASPVNELLESGHRINIIGSEDIWYRIFRNNKFYYINKANVWLVN